MKHYEIEHSVEEQHSDESGDTGGKAHSRIGHKRPRGRIQYRSASDYDKGDQTADKTRNESRSIDLRHIPYSGHGLLDGLGNSLRTVDQPDKTYGEAKAATLQAL